MRWRLRRLKDEGLVESVVLPQAARQRAWFLTERGVRIVARFPELRHVASPPLAEDETDDLAVEVLCRLMGGVQVVG
ncbi:MULTISPECIES: hypothetical protein [Kitasatospora]|uniref:HTH marR-type domain-containing protein n=1 Tax=Kitasatospora cathayae TaxID=3004092 RepID=A0ABY7QF18_9ACTN|nr:hypothetical protein [Kitasatospora sp. HUAS 3-15]WBP91318.1 hypothetical protein O1G21_39175 [Kitasatospora sp. HUAS 3-15]